MRRMVDPLDPRPLYMQVAEEIVARINRGELNSGDPIPSELSIQQEFDVSRGTARRMVQELRDRGLVVTIAQRGTYVK
jgi:GntR family transcriptional regulator